MPILLTLKLDGDEISLLCEALDSFEYWEHRDELPHNSGHITIMDDQDFEQQIILGGWDEDHIEASQEAWEKVKAARALEEKLAAALQKADDEVFDEIMEMDLADSKNRPHQRHPGETQVD